MGFEKIKSGFRFYYSAKIHQAFEKEDEYNRPGVKLKSKEHFNRKAPGLNLVVYSYMLLVMLCIGSLFSFRNKTVKADYSATELFSENFSDISTPNFGNKFTTEGDSNFWGTVDANGTNYLWTDYLNTPYLGNANTSLVSIPVDLSNQTANSIVLSFNISCDTELRDSNWKDYLAISGFNGLSWTELARYDETALGNEDFHNENIQLTSFKNNDFKFKLNWITDGTNNEHLGCALWPIQIKAYNFSSPVITVNPSQDGMTVLDNSVVISYTADGIAKTKTFDNLDLGINNLEIAAINPIDPRFESTIQFKITRKEPLYLDSTNFSTGWNMVSFPDGDDITNKLFLPDSFKVRRYNSSINGYDKSENGEMSLSPGSGFWVKIDDINKIIGLRYPLKTANIVKTSVTKGWNFLGNPFQTNLPIGNLSVEYKDGSSVSFAEAVSRKEVAGYLCSYESTSNKQYYLVAADPSRYRTSAPSKTYISPFNGFWMIVKSDQVNKIIMSK